MPTDTLSMSSLQILCDAWVADRIVRLQNGQYCLTTDPDWSGAARATWPDGASAADIAASFDRVVANLKLGYRQAGEQPLDAQVGISVSDNPAAIYRAITVAIVVACLAWSGLAIYGAAHLLGWAK